MGARTVQKIYCSSSENILQAHTLQFCLLHPNMFIYFSESSSHISVFFNSRNRKAESVHHGKYNVAGIPYNFLCYRPTKFCGLKYSLIAVDKT